MLIERCEIFRAGERVPNIPEIRGNGIQGFTGVQVEPQSDAINDGTERPVCGPEKAVADLEPTTIGRHASEREIDAECFMRF